MKNILYIASLLLLVFTACDPMEDTYKEIDEANKGKIADEQYFAERTVLDTEYTLVDADYALSTNEGVKKYKNFSSRATAKDNLAQILDAKMVYGKPAVDYKVTYKYYRGSLAYLKDYTKYLEDVAALNSHELSAGDYDSMGTNQGEPGKFDNFSASSPAEDYLPAFLKGKYAAAKTGDIVVVTYKFYEKGKGTKTVTESWQFDGTTWAKTDAGPKAPELPTGVKVYELVKNDYTSMGFKYPNFSGSAKPTDYLPTFLKVKFPYAKEGDKYLVVYKFYADKKTTNQANEYTLTDGVWTVYSKTVMQVATMSYKMDKKAWAFVPPIKFVKTDEAATVEYTLTDADYALVGNGKYKNFDRREGKADADEAVVVEKLSKILKAQTTVAITEGTVYAVTFTYYDGAKKQGTINLKAVLDE